VIKQNSAKATYYSRGKHNIKKAYKGKHHQSNEKTMIAGYFVAKEGHCYLLNHRIENAQPLPIKTA